MRSDIEKRESRFEDLFLWMNLNGGSRISSWKLPTIDNSSAHVLELRKKWIDYWKKFPKRTDLNEFSKWILVEKSKDPSSSKEKG